MSADQAVQANVIKRVGDGRRVLVKNQILTAEHQAEDIVSSARREAESIIQQAHADSASIREEAYNDGYQTSLAEFQARLVEVREIKLNALRDAEADLLKLSVKIAEKILGKELSVNKRAIVDIVSKAIQNARQRENITVHVNPSDIETVSNNRENFVIGERAQIFDFVADPSVSAGGCVIETEIGRIDARLETQFNALEEALLGRSMGVEESSSLQTP